MKTILAVVSRKFKQAPGHLTYGATYFEKVGGVDNKCHVEIKYYEDKTGPLGKLLTIWAILRLVLNCKHDILYFTIDPAPLFGVSLLKYIGLYKKPIYVWKYVALKKKRGLLQSLFQKILYDSFNMVFMMTESHVGESISSGVITEDRCKYMRWGEDPEYIDKLPILSKAETFTFISTGKAYRDFDTLCQAFNGVKGAKLTIFTGKTWGNLDYKTALEQYANPNIEVYYVDEIILGQYGTILDFLFAQMKVSDCAVIICKDVDFGVGYTAVLDSMVCRLPIISTWNKDNPIDIDKTNIGNTVPVYDVEALRSLMQSYVDNVEMAKEKGARGRNLIDTEYNIRRVAKDVLKEMMK